MLSKNIMPFTRKAMYVNRSAKRTRKAYSKPPIKKLVSNYKKKTLSKFIKKKVNSMIETKELRNSQANQNLYSYPSTATIPNNYLSNNIYDTSVVYQSLGQNTGEGGRIGNVVTPVQFHYKFTLTAGATLTVPVVARLYVVSYKFDLNNSTPSDIWSGLQNANGANFFDNGNASSGMSGTLTDLLLPFNKDAWNIHRVKTYKVAPSTSPTTGTTGNNDFKYFIRDKINLLPYINKKLRWNDSSNTSFNKKVYIIWELLSASGGTITDVSTLMGLLNYDFTFKYKDA